METIIKGEVEKISWIFPKLSGIRIPGTTVTCRVVLKNVEGGAPSKTVDVFMRPDNFEEISHIMGEEYPFHNYKSLDGESIIVRVKGNYTATGAFNAYDIELVS